jgi:hypothetical protein
MTEPDRNPTPDLIHAIPARRVRADEPNEPDASQRWREELIKHLTEGAPMEVRHITAGVGPFRRVRRLTRSALRRVLGRVLSIFGSGTALRGGQVPPASPSCREGEGQ